MSTPMFDLPDHLRIGLNSRDQGPVEENDGDFNHFGCWCGDPACEEYMNAESTESPQG